MIKLPLKMEIFLFQLMKRASLCSQIFMLVFLAGNLRLN